jgi:hypothetical protein
MKKLVLILGLVFISFTVPAKKSVVLSEQEQIDQIRELFKAAIQAAGLDADPLSALKNKLVPMPWETEYWQENPDKLLEIQCDVQYEAYQNNNIEKRLTSEQESELINFLYANCYKYKKFLL